MFDKKIFKSQLLDFLDATIIICKNNSDKLIFEDLKHPQFFPNGKYKKFEVKNSADYDFFVNRSIKQEIMNVNQYSILTKFFVTKEFQNYNMKLFNDTGSANVEVKPNYANEFPLKFLIKYLDQNQNFSINKKIFEELFENFFFFLQNILEDEYVTPLFNFESEIDRKGIVINGVGIRKISELEFYIFSNLEENANLSSIFHNLTHVMFMKYSSPDLDSGYDIVNERFLRMIDSLSLFKEGSPRFGGIYRNINNPWIHYDSKYETEIISKIPLKMEKNEKKQLQEIYDSLEKINFSIKGNRFLEISKKRFVTALSRIDKFDQLIDLMISLESLYVSSPGEITVRLSNRMATVLAKDDSEREEIWRFSKKVYNMRSGIIHGEGLRSNEINGKKYTLDEIIEKLVKLNRQSLIIFMKLINHYSENNKIDKISEDIDKGLINRDYLKEFRLKFK